MRVHKRVTVCASGMFESSSGVFLHLVPSHVFRQAQLLELLIFAILTSQLVPGFPPSMPP